jgi:hypothetical protein
LFSAGTTSVLNLITLLNWVYQTITMLILKLKPDKITFISFGFLGKYKFYMVFQTKKGKKYRYVVEGTDMNKTVKRVQK